MKACQVILIPRSALLDLALTEEQARTVRRHVTQQQMTRQGLPDGGKKRAGGGWQEASATLREYLKAKPATRVDWQVGGSAGRRSGFTPSSGSSWAWVLATRSAPSECL